MKSCFFNDGILISWLIIIPYPRNRVGCHPTSGSTGRYKKKYLPSSISFNQDAHVLSCCYLLTKDSYHFTISQRQSIPSAWRQFRSPPPVAQSKLMLWGSEDAEMLNLHPRPMERCVGTCFWIIIYIYIYSHRRGVFVWVLKNNASQLRRQES